MKRIMLLALLMSSPAYAQHAERRFAQDDSARAVHGWTTVRIAKWSVLAVSTGAAIYGFAENRAADHKYADIEQLCADTPASCARTSENGPYSDAALEQRYQSVVKEDKRARSALLAGQLGIAASVVLFVLDLPKSATPQDIPYQPHSFRVGVQGSALALRFELATR